MGSNLMASDDFDDCEIGPYVRAWDEISMRGGTLIKGGSKWIPEG